MNHDVRPSIRRVLGWVVVALAALSCGRAAVAQNTVKIMPIGDSITAGYNGTVGYRYALWFQLPSDGTNYEFVGRATAPINPVALEFYPRYNQIGFSKRHEGHSGFTTTMMLNELVGGVSFDASVNSWKPDVAIIHLGTRDVGLGSSLPPAFEPAVGNIKAIIDKLRAPNPSVKILLAKAIPMGPNSQFSESNIANLPGFRAKMDEIAASKTTPQSPVAVVDLFTGLSTGAHLQDGIHPNVWCERLMADRIAIVLQRVLRPNESAYVPPIVVGNPSFEDWPITTSPVVDDFSNVAFEQRNNGWHTLVSPGVVTAVWRPTDRSYLGAGTLGSFLGRPKGAEGSQVASLYSAPSAGGGIIEQVLGATFAPAKRYTLRLAIGKRLEPNPYGSQYGGYKIELRAINPNGTYSLIKGVSSTDPGAIVPDPGTFKDATLIIEAEEVSSHIGKPIVIRFSQNSTAANTATDFDNVRFESSASVCLGDLNYDGVVNTADLTKFLGRFGSTCP